MKIGILIPDRGDRPRFLANCLRQLRSQTVQPDIVELVNDEPLTKHCDITYRYRTGYERLRGKDLDVIAFIENDEYYAPNYLETMTANWSDAGRPELFGTYYTYYYHIGVFGYFKMEHHQRSCAMSTLIRPDMNFSWCPDYEALTDSYLFGLFKRSYKLCWPPVICIGIKHGVGMTGGTCHTTNLDRFTRGFGTPDPSADWLRKHTTPESFEFFSNYFKDQSPH